MDFAHLRGKKIFLTVNTLLKNKEIETELFTYLKPLYEYGLDAVIVQDYGVFQFIYRNFPGLAQSGSLQPENFPVRKSGVFMMKRVWRLKALFTGHCAIVIPDSV